MAIDREKVLVAAQKFVEKKKFDKAVLEYQKLIQEDPNDARTLLKIGDLQSKMEAYADAVGTYERVGKFYAQQGFALKAIAVYKQIREIIAKHVPQHEERYGHIAPKLAELYVQLGLTSDALAALDEVATRFQRQGRDPEAIEVFRKIVELDPTNPLPHLRLAEALSRSKDAEGAVTEFAMAASQLVKLGRRDDALKVVERLLHHKQDPVHARIAAELYLARNQPNDGLQALAKLQICFQHNPKDLDTLALLARAFNAIGQAAKGIEVQKEIARIAKEQGKTELFKQVVEKLQRLAPNDEGVRALLAAPAPGPVSSVPPQQQQQQQQRHAPWACCMSRCALSPVYSRASSSAPSLWCVMALTWCHSTDAATSVPSQAGHRAPSMWSPIARRVCLLSSPTSVLSTWHRCRSCCSPGPPRCSSTTASRASCLATPSKATLAAATAAVASETTLQNCGH